MLVAWLVLSSAALAVPQDFDGRRFYSGDLHVHTGASGDGMSSDVGDCTGVCGAMSELGEAARASGLDFIAVTDHVNGWTISSPDLFEGALHHVVDAHVPGEFLVIPGAEVWFELPDRSPLGHKNLMLFGSDDQVAGFDMFAAQHHGSLEQVADCNGVWGYASSLQDQFGPVLLIPHHPSAVIPMITDWSCQDSLWSPAVEIYSEHGNSEVPEPDFDPQWSDPAPPGTTVFEAMHPDGPGHRLGFVGGTDRHDTHAGAVCTTETAIQGPPYGGGLTMAVLGPDEFFDRDALYAALVDRRTYATSGPDLPAVLDVLVEGRLVGSMGQVVVVPEGSSVQVRVRVPEEHADVVEAVVFTTPDGRLQGSPDGVGAWSLPADDLPAFVYAELQVDGAAWNPDCVDGGDTDDERVWLSPVWLEPGDPQPPAVVDDGGCGCAAAAHPVGLWWVALLVGWRRRVTRV